MTPARYAEIIATAIRWPKKLKRIEEIPLPIRWMTREEMKERWPDSSDKPADAPPPENP